MASKNKLIFTCKECGAQFFKWVGRCASCNSWDSLVEDVVSKTKPRFDNAWSSKKSAILLKEVSIEAQSRLKTDIAELDRVLGGGMVIGSVVLVGGNPGIGKSTLLLQALCNLGKNYNVLYVTGEESLQQIAVRASRLGLSKDNISIFAETQIEQILLTAQKEKPQVMVIDSIQTMYTENIPSAPGGVSQVRESAAQLVNYAKETGTALFIVGHVTKDGSLAGPRILEHIVDCVLYFEGDKDSRYRIIRATKNRFGAVNELGVFAMTDGGLREVKNPSSIFLSHNDQKISGSSIMVVWEGSRSLLIEVQALVDESHQINSRRVALGLDQNRLIMLLAVLSRHGRVPTHNQDIFINVVGGMKITDTGSDLALLFAVLSSMRNRPLDSDLVVFGEIGLGGEIRPVPNGQDRLSAARKHGFKKAIIPKANAPKKTIDDFSVVTVQHLSEIMHFLK